MKRLFLSAVFLFFANMIFAQVPACPTLHVSGGMEFLEGTPITFIANVSGDGNFTYNWSVSAGTISSGQGTSSITVDTEGLGGQSITATMELGGAAPECARSTSSTTMIDAKAKALPAKKTVVKKKTKVKKPKA